jgi:hypothetical protein
VEEYSGTDDVVIISTIVANAETVHTPAIAAANEEPTRVVVESDASLEADADEDAVSETVAVVVVDVVDADRLFVEVEVDFPLCCCKTVRRDAPTSQSF